MLSQPTTDQVIRGIVHDLKAIIEPELHSEPAKVALAMITQILTGCAVRAAHELAWINEESAAIEQAVGGIDDAETQAALADYRAADPTVHLDGAVIRYGHASRALSAAVEAAYRAHDQEQAARLRALLAVRSANEMAIMGQLELVGRG